MSSDRLPARFWYLWCANGLANLADGLLLVALPLVAVSLTRDPLLVAGLTVAARAPWLLCTLPSGVLADRHDRRRLVVVSLMARCTVLLVFGFLWSSGVTSLWALYSLALVLGGFEVLFASASGPLIPALVAPRLLDRANGRIQGAEITLNEFVGPPLGGVLMAVSLIAAISVPGVAFLFAAAALIPLRANFRPARVDNGPTTLRRDLKDGLDFLRGDELLTTLTVMVAVMAAGHGAWFSVLVLFATGEMGLSPKEYGLLLTASAVGGIIASVLSEHAVKRFGRHKVLMANIAGTAVLYGAPALTTNPWAVGAACLVGGATGVMWSVVTVSISQVLVPDELRGRVGAIRRLVSWGTLPVGAALGGVVGQLFGLTAVFTGAAVVTLLLLTLRSRITDERISIAMGGAS